MRHAPTETEKSPPLIRPPSPADFPTWLSLWNANNRGVRNDDLAKITWARLLDPSWPVHGFIACANDDAAGLVHYILHPVTGHLNPACYMQDLYVDSKFRGRGIGRRLVEHLADEGRKNDWARLYWLADGTDDVVQGFYRKIGIPLNFTFHVMPL